MKDLSIANESEIKHNFFDTTSKILEYIKTLHNIHSDTLKTIKIGIESTISCSGNKNNYNTEKTYKKIKRHIDKFNTAKVLLLLNHIDELSNKLGEKYHISHNSFCCGSCGVDFCDDETEFYATTHNGQKHIEVYYKDNPVFECDIIGLINNRENMEDYINEIEKTVKSLKDRNKIIYDEEDDYIYPDLIFEHKYEIKDYKTYKYYEGYIRFKLEHYDFNMNETDAQDYFENNFVFYLFDRHENISFN